MRVAADQLLGAVLGDRRQVAGAALLEQQREEVDLEEHVAELVEQLRVVAARGRRRRARRPPRRVRHDRALVLLAVPGALAAQPARELVQAREGLLELRGRHARPTRSGLGAARAGRAGGAGRGALRRNVVLAVLHDEVARQTVRDVQRLVKSATNFVSEVCCCWASSCCLIVALTDVSGCWTAGVTFVTLKM